MSARLDREAALDHALPATTPARRICGVLDVTDRARMSASKLTKRPCVV
jgi:hypothetical protein